jgi:ABC-type dipeptide/oligopeptide/nickel transport system permease subunit
VRTRLPPRARVSFLIGALLVGGFIVAAVLAPVLGGALGHGPFDLALPPSADPPTPPDRQHLLGTDDLGRDILSRLLHGARISLLVGVVAQAIALVLGTAVGAAAGYAGGRVDALLMRIADVVFSLPAPLLALAVIAAIPEPESAPILRRLPNPSVALIFVVLGGIGWSGIARLVRGELLKLRALEFAQAAQALGANRARVVLRHLLPNATAPLIVAATLGVGGNILTEAWLSFLGVGARPPLPSWGTMITEGQAYFLSKPWVCVAPGLAILLVVLGFNLLGDALAARIDPRRDGAPA